MSATEGETHEGGLQNKEVAEVGAGQWGDQIAGNVRSIRLNSNSLRNGRRERNRSVTVLRGLPGVGVHLAVGRVAPFLSLISTASVLPPASNFFRFQTVFGVCPPGQTLSCRRIRGSRVKPWSRRFQADQTMPRWNLPSGDERFSESL